MSLYKDYVENLRKQHNPEELDKVNSIKEDKQKNKKSSEDKHTKQMIMYQYEKRAFQKERESRLKSVSKPMTNIKDYDEMDKITAESTNVCLKKPWTRLNIDMKINRLYQYGYKLSRDYNLSEDETNEVKNYLRVLLNDKLLTKQYVDYDVETGNINLISGLNITFEDGMKLSYDKDNKIKQVKKKEIVEEKSNSNSDSNNSSEESDVSSKPKRKVVKKFDDIQGKVAYSQLQNIINKSVKYRKGINIKITENRNKK